MRIELTISILEREIKKLINSIPALPKDIPGYKEYIESRVIEIQECIEYLKQKI